MHTVEGTGSILASTSSIVSLTLQERQSQACLTAACEQEHTKCTPAHSQVALQRGCVCVYGRGGEREREGEGGRGREREGGGGGGA